MQIHQRDYDHADSQQLIDRVQAEYTRIYGGPDADALSPEQFRPPQGVFAVGYLGPDPVAMGAWRRLPDGRAEVKRVYVHDEYRGRGLSRRMMSWLEDSARAAGIPQLVLETGELQTTAIALYRSLGYLDIAPFGHYGGEPGTFSLGKLLTPGATGITTGA